MSKRRVGDLQDKKASKPKKQKEQEEECNISNPSQIKESIKNPAFNKKQRKASTKQTSILQDIENENTTRHIKELCNNFEPPVCKRCQNKSADRVCVCQQCDSKDILSLICGKCHITKHTVSKEKPELDVQEFFVKLGTFLNETKINSSFREQGINVERLQNSFGRIAEFEAILGDIEGAFKREISTYKSPEVIENSLSNNVAQCLSEPTFENIQEQLSDIKEAVVFESNGFKWQGIQEKQKSINNQVELLRNQSKQLKSSINESFEGSIKIDLSLLKMKEGKKQNLFKYFKFGLSKTNQITIEKQAKPSLSQCYLDFQFDPAKKYTMKFTIQSLNQSEFYIGLQQKEQVDIFYLQLAQSNFLFKKFFNSQPQFMNSLTPNDCSKVLQGKLFDDTINQGDSFEMRFCFKEQILEFSTLPDHNDVVSKLDNINFNTSLNANYVITFSFSNNIVLSIDSLEQNFFFPTYQSNQK